MTSLKNTGLKKIMLSNCEYHNFYIFDAIDYIQLLLNYQSYEDFINACICVN